MIKYLLCGLIVLTGCASEEVAVPETEEQFQTICVAGAYERTNGRMVVDMFAPTVGVETIEDVSKETYDQIIKEIGSCQWKQY